jgi:membrane-bound lytic murein transglycosylase D
MDKSLKRAGRETWNERKAPCPAKRKQYIALLSKKVKGISNIGGGDMKPPRVDRILMMGLMICFFGCASVAEHKPVENKEPSQGLTSEPISPPQTLHPLPVQPPPPSEVKESAIPEDQEPPPCPVPEANPQKMLDSALEYCQTSNELWEHGDLEAAIDALDTAYSLLLEVDVDDDPELLQQKEDIRFTIAKRIIEAYASRLTTTQGTGNAIPLVMNDHVKRALASFQGREKDSFLSAYIRSGKYRPAILKALRDAGLPEELSWLPLIESGYKVRALSRARALGLWQFIASTGYKYGLKRNRWIDERMDPEKSTLAAISYLKELHQMFGDWTTVLAAYNCGEWTVLNRIRTQKINYLDNFWDLYEQLPRETASYVPRFLAVLHILADPQAYGFDLPTVEKPLKTEEVTVNKQVHLKNIAERLHVDYGLLKEMNPELRYNTTPKSAYALKVPPGKGKPLLAELDDIPAWHPPVPSYYVHRVRRGDSLSGLACHYRTSVRAIMAANRLRKSSYLRVGWKLRIPTSAKVRPPMEQQAVQTARIDRKLQTYVVKRGDSVWKIAKRYSTTTRTIRSLNGLRSSRLRVGQVLRVPGSSKSPSSQQAKTYRVRKGDSPYLVAERYQMNLAEFLSLNNLTPGSTIYPGQTLLVLEN